MDVHKDLDEGKEIYRPPVVRKQIRRSGLTIRECIGQSKEVGDLPCFRQDIVLVNCADQLCGSAVDVMDLMKGESGEPIVLVLSWEGS